MRNSLKTVFFLSAFAPSLLAWAIVKFNTEGYSITVFQLTFIGIIGSILPVGILHLVKTQGEQFNIKAKKIESNDIVVFGFVASYFLPFIAKANEISDSLLIIIILLLMFFMWIVNNIPAHPLLRVIKFHFYKLESDDGVVYTLITRRELLSPSEVKHVKKISSSILLEHK